MPAAQIVAAMAKAIGEVHVESRKIGTRVSSVQTLRGRVQRCQATAARSLEWAGSSAVAQGAVQYCRQPDASQRDSFVDRGDVALVIRLVDVRAWCDERLLRQPPRLLRPLRGCAEGLRGQTCVDDQFLQPRHVGAIVE